MTHVLGWLSVAALVVAGYALAVETAQYELLLDFSDYRPQRRPAGAPTEFTVVLPELDFRRPIEFSVPTLQVMIRSAELSSAGDLLLEVQIRNTGTESFLIPVSPDFDGIQQPSNKGRRSLIFNAVFSNPDTGSLGMPVSAITTAGSETVPNTLVALAPGATALLRLPVPSFSQLDWVRRRSVPTFDVSVTLREWPLEDARDLNDRRYVISERTAPLSSENSIRVQWE